MHLINCNLISNDFNDALTRVTHSLVILSVDTMMLPERVNHGHSSPSRDRHYHATTAIFRRNKYT